MSDLGPSGYCGDTRVVRSNYVLVCPETGTVIEADKAIIVHRDDLPEGDPAEWEIIEDAIRFGMPIDDSEFN